ncbi:Ion channel [Natronincola peptidivorans]|uniref:Ion channel n=1 Tax=Natronincola peptidivorans TaxID=426128 RepID=A0A1I0GH95_9FIRM|nr:potassium channel family protein [Natronincola peptidivorans]SET70387.1 Ion channel [Natronincola peptidivorans]
MDILKRVMVLLTIYIMVVTLNIITFAHLYHKHSIIVDSNTIPEDIVNSEVLPLRDAIYFSGVTYLTIGYGDIVAINTLGKYLSMLQGFSGVIINSIFTGMFLYYLVKRPMNILITNNIYIRYKESTERFYLSVRVGNKGRALVNVNRVLEVFVYENSIRKRRFHLAQEYYFFERLLYWDIDLHDETNKVLLDYIKAAVFQDENILFRISVIGTDVEAGELVFLSKYYSKHNIHFIKDYVSLYKWRGHQRTEINWKDFQKTRTLDHDHAEIFRNI